MYTQSHHSTHTHTHAHAHVHTHTHTHTHTHRYSHTTPHILTAEELSKREEERRETIRQYRAWRHAVLQSRDQDRQLRNEEKLKQLEEAEKQQVLCGLEWLQVGGYELLIGGGLLDPQPPSNHMQSQSQPLTSHYHSQTLATTTN